MLVGSTFILGTTFIIGFSFNTITGILIFILSLQMLTKPMVVVTQTEIQMKNLWGMVVKRHAFSPSEISLQENGIYINTKKIVASWWADIPFETLHSFIAKLPR